jgi:hypothetical protein
MAVGRGVSAVGAGDDLPNDAAWRRGGHGLGLLPECCGGLRTPTEVRSAPPPRLEPGGTGQRRPAHTCAAVSAPSSHGALSHRLCPMIPFVDRSKRVIRPWSSHEPHSGSGACGVLPDTRDDGAGRWRDHPSGLGRPGACAAAARAVRRAGPSAPRLWSRAELTGSGSASLRGPGPARSSTGSSGFVSQERNTSALSVQFRGTDAGVHGPAQDTARRFAAHGVGQADSRRNEDVLRRQIRISSADPLCSRPSRGE